MADTISILSELRSNYNCFNESDEPYYRALSEAIRALSAERKGHWIHISTEADGNAYYQCSVCGKGECHVPIIKVSYCWNCGARMEGEQ